MTNQFAFQAIVQKNLDLQFLKCNIDKTFPICTALIQEENLEYIQIQQIL